MKNVKHWIMVALLTGLGLMTVSTAAKDADVYIIYTQANKQDVLYLKSQFMSKQLRTRPLNIDRVAGGDFTGMQKLLLRANSARVQLVLTQEVFEQLPENSLDNGVVINGISADDLAPVFSKIN